MFSFYLLVHFPAVIYCDKNFGAAKNKGAMKVNAMMYLSFFALVLGRSGFVTAP